MAFKWRAGDLWDVGTNKLDEQLNTLRNEPDQVQIHFEPAFLLLSDLIRKKEVHSADVDRALKSSALDDDVNKALYAEQN